jgi:hypothetical protein
MNKLDRFVDSWKGPTLIAGLGLTAFALRIIERGVW